MTLIIDIIYYTYMRLYGIIETRGNGAGPRPVCKTGECSAQEAMVGSIPTTPLHIFFMNCREKTTY